MKQKTVLDIDHRDYSIRLLVPEDTGAIQTLFGQCRDYFVVVDGREPPPNAAEEAFNAVPPGRNLNDKFVFGVFHNDENLVGILDCLRRYPDETTWWIGLLLLSPDIRNQGVGQMVVHCFNDYVRSNGGQAVSLGVVQDNQRAFGFWKNLGFVFLRTTEPRRFESKLQTVDVLRLTLKKRICICIRVYVRGGGNCHGKL